MKLEDVVGITCVVITLSVGAISIYWCETARQLETNTLRTNEAMRSCIVDVEKFGEKNAETWNDAWGKPILVKITDNEDINRIEVTSAGPDGEYFTTDDLTDYTKTLKKHTTYIK